MQHIHMLWNLKNASSIKQIKTRKYCSFPVAWHVQKHTTNSAVCMCWRPAKQSASRNRTTYHQIFYKNSGKQQEPASVSTAWCFVLLYFESTLRIIFSHKKYQTIRLGGGGKQVFQDEKWTWKSARLIYLGGSYISLSVYELQIPPSNAKRLLCLGQCDSVPFLIHQVSDGVWGRECNSKQNRCKE